MERNSMVLIYYVNLLEVDRCKALLFFEVLRFQVKIMSSLRDVQLEASEFLLSMVRYVLVEYVLFIPYLP